MERDLEDEQRPGALARALLYAIVVLSPLVMTRLIGALPLTHDAFELPKAVVVRFAAALAFLVWTIAVSRERRGVRLSWWLVPVAVYVGWVVAATALSASPVVSLLGGHGRLDGLLTVITYALLGFLALQLLTTGRHMIHLARAMTLTGAIVSLYGVAQTLGFHPFYQLGTNEFTADRAFASLGNPVFLGGYLVLVLPVMTSVALGATKRVWRGLGWVGVVLATVSLIGTATRGAWLVGALEIAVLLVIVVRKRVRLPMTAYVALGTGAVASSLVVVRSLRSPDQVMNIALRLGSMFRGDDGSTTERFMIMRAAIRSIAARPWFGFGPGRFVEAFNRFRPEEHVAAFPGKVADNAHNLVLQIAATSGVIAAIAWLVSALMPLSLSARAAWSKEGGQQRLALSGLWLGAAGYTLFLMSGISVIGVSSTFWIVLGALAGLGRVHEVEVGRALRISVIGVASVLLAAVSVWSATRFVADMRYMRAREQVHADVPGDPLVSTQAALALSPYDVTYRRHVLLLVQDTEPEKAKAAALAVLEVEPDDAITLILLAETHLQLGEHEQAARVVQRAKDVAPNNPAVLELGRKLVR